MPYANLRPDIDWAEAVPIVFDIVVTAMYCLYNLWTLGSDNPGKIRDSHQSKIIGIPYVVCKNHQILFIFMEVIMKTSSP